MSYIGGFINILMVVIGLISKYLLSKNYNNNNF